MPLSPEEELSAQRTAEDHLQPPPPALARPASRLRRTSQAALNRFSRNRASTVSGAQPALETNKEQPTTEYGAHVVDVLDVIGKLLDGLEDGVANIAIAANNMAMFIRPGGRSPVNPHQCAKLTVHSQLGRFYQPHAHLSIVEGASI